MPAGFRQCGPLNGFIVQHARDRSSSQRGPMGLTKEGVARDAEQSTEPYDANLDEGLLRTFMESLNAAGILTPWNVPKTGTAGATVSRAGTVQQLKQSIVAGARAELQYWRAEKLTETQPKGKKRIQEYWKEGAGRHLSLKQSSRKSWSAAFIDYVIKKAGAGAKFTYAWKHVTYIKASIENLEQNNSNPFRAYPVDDARAVPEKGDLVCNWRKTKRTYDDIRKMKTAYGYMHCDIVVDKIGGNLQLIGGNKSGGKVDQVEIAVNNQGLVINPGDKYVAVIKVEETGKPAAGNKRESI